MTSQPVQQTVSLHILHNISQRKDNQTIKFGQVIEYNNRNIFVQKSGRLVPDLNFFFKKALYEIKASGLQISFNIFW